VRDDRACNRPEIRTVPIRKRGCAFWTSAYAGLPLCAWLGRLGAFLAGVPELWFSIFLRSELDTVQIDPAHERIDSELAVRQDVSDREARLARDIKSGSASGR
jgi:hypothetical protein